MRTARTGPPAMHNPLPCKLPPVNRITDTCENITFPQLRLQAVIKGRQLQSSITVMAHSHCTGPGQGLENGGYFAMYYTLHRDRDRYKESLFSIVPVPFPAPVPVPCSVYKQSVNCPVAEEIVTYSKCAVYIIPSHYLKNYQKWFGVVLVMVPIWESFCCWSTPPVWCPTRVCGRLALTISIIVRNLAGSFWGLFTLIFCVVRCSC